MIISYEFLESVILPISNSNSLVTLNAKLATQLNSTSCDDRTNNAVNLEVYIFFPKIMRKICWYAFTENELENSFFYVII